MKIYIVTGEKSGDQHAADIVRHLNSKDKNLKIRAWGGEKLKEQGVTLAKHINEISYMGFWEVFKNLFKIFNNLKFCKRDILNFSPDLIFLVDYPGFNLKIAEFASNNNIKVYYYISPKIWAWKSSRIHIIKKYIDKMFVIFPFEKEFYKNYGFDVEYYGNPIYDSVINNKYTLEPSPNLPVISLFPGSRKQEIDKILPLMLKAVNDFSKYQLIISATNSFSIDYYNKFIENYKLSSNYNQTCNIDILFDRPYDILSISKAALVTSGTATLETALMNVPQLVCYKTSLISYFIAKYFINIKYISLVNILLDKLVVDELIQFDLTVENIKKGLDKLINDDNRVLSSDYNNLKNLLKSKGVAKKLASEILDIKAS